ncbi:hypothetical protein EW145_g1924 [Phellinidium pouzarii]|uniref:Uncharacterized protein n=1 Tax=Phellinidium pouzarii TaxID=167371 RepID=A0A4S4LEF0_9AGAM|nr:hypothetical protein EW145_g1924 [Phellinidium pouzarii]
MLPNINPPVRPWHTAATDLKDKFKQTCATSAMACVLLGCWLCLWQQRMDKFFRLAELLKTGLTLQIKITTPDGDVSECIQALDKLYGETRSSSTKTSSSSFTISAAQSTLNAKFLEARRAYRLANVQRLDCVIRESLSADLVERLISDILEAAETPMGTQTADSAVAMLVSATRGSISTEANQSDHS